jgi:hypothetical protein
MMMMMNDNDGCCGIAGSQHLRIQSPTIKQLLFLPMSADTKVNPTTSGQQHTINYLGLRFFTLLTVSKP